ncbi:hypothetical protein ABPG72_003744 [Tetrahymena utriculariae]
MKKQIIQIVLILVLISYCQSAVTIKNQNGKILRSDYVSQVLDETQKLIMTYNNNNDIDDKSIEQLQNKLFIQDTQSACQTDNECLNEGICYEKQCFCKTLFVGPICQYQLSSPPEVSKFWFVVICICSVVAGILLMILVNYIIKMRQEAKLQREGEYNDNKYEIWQQKLDNQQ